jgi:hypothetical protein
VSLLEAHIVVRGREHPAMLGKLHRFLDEIEAVIVPFDEHQARLADAAFLRYGKGQGHRAQFNFGDCVHRFSVVFHRIRQKNTSKSHWESIGHGQREVCCANIAENPPDSRADKSQRSCWSRRDPVATPILAYSPHPVFPDWRFSGGICVKR